MQAKLRCVLLIDDNPADNYLHRLVLEEDGCFETIVTALDGEEGLGYLQSTADGSHQVPDLLFLDINMPGMDGWQFLKQYQHLPPAQRAQRLVVLLSTSTSTWDANRTKDLPMTATFRSKPLTSDMLQELLDTYFTAG